MRAVRSGLWGCGRVPLLAFVGVVGACQGNHAVVADGGAGGGGNAAGAAGAGGQSTAGAGGTVVGAGGAGGCAQDLSGTWDLVATLPGHQPGAGVIVIGADILSIAITSTGRIGFVGNKLEYTAKPTKLVTWQLGAATPRTIATTNTPAAFSTGILPFAAGGVWTFSTSREQCMASVAPGLVSGHCAGQPGDYFASGPDWPYHIPLVVNDRTYTATHASTAASSFGDLGGVWHTQSDFGFGNLCTITVQGAMMMAQCTGVTLAGTTVLTIGGDCVASGTTPEGVELGARRR
jgi:hypothetical protein